MSGYGEQGGYGGGERERGYGGGEREQGYGGGGGERGEYQDTRHHEQQGGYGQPTGYDEDLSGAMNHAEQHSGESGDRGIFGNVLGFLQQNKHSVGNQQVDEQSAVQAHQQYFGGGGNNQQQADSGSMGSAAAMQALKMFTGGSGGQSSSSGGGQNAFIGMAMAQASKLFEQQASQGNVASGASKESAVQQAGEMALKMYMKSQMSGGSSGGASGLMSMASKFL